MKMMRVKRIRVAEVRKEQEARETNRFMLRAPWLLLVRCLGWWDGKPMKGNQQRFISHMLGSALLCSAVSLIVKFVSLTAIGMMMTMMMKMMMMMMMTIKMMMMTCGS